MAHNGVDDFLRLTFEVVGRDVTAPSTNVATKTVPGDTILSLATDEPARRHRDVSAEQRRHPDGHLFRRGLVEDRRLRHAEERALHGDLVRDEPTAEPLLGPPPTAANTWLSFPAVQDSAHARVLLPSQATTAAAKSASSTVQATSARAGFATWPFAWCMPSRSSRTVVGAS